VPREGQNLTLFFDGSYRSLQTLKFLAGLEAHSFAGRNVDFLAGAGIAADASLARLDTEDAETAKLDTLTAAESIFQGVENGFDGLLGFGAADVRGGDHGVDDVQLDHTSLQTGRGQMLEGKVAGCQGAKATLHWLDFLEVRGRGLFRCGNEEG
jgi:hypothetical protein